MNYQFLISTTLRWLLSTSIAIALIVLLIQLTGAAGFGLAIAYSLPFSLLPVVLASLAWSISFSKKRPCLLSVTFDHYLIGIFFGLTIAFTAFIMNDRSRIRSANQYPEFAAPIESINQASPEAIEEKTAIDWKNSPSVCLHRTESSIENNCPVRLSVTYCWKLDPSQDWGTKHDDCAGDQRRKLKFPPGTNPVAVPWCRSLFGPCLAELVVLDARVLD